MSTVPVVQDIGDLGSEGAAFKRGKRKKAFVALLGLAAMVGGAAYAIPRLDQPPTAAIEVPKAHAAAPVMPAKTFEPTPVAAPAPPPEPTPAAAPAPSTEEKSDSESPKRLSEDMKQALLANDQTKKSAKGSKKRAAKSARGVTREASGPSTGFKAGGNANDPLNAKL
jgi:type IV secretory pathway VirB10-like protein